MMIRADGIVEFRFQIGDVVEAHEFHAGDERLERLAIFHRIRNRKSAERASMKRVFECEEARLRSAAVFGVRMRVGAREF